MTLTELQTKIDEIAQYMRDEDFTSLTITLNPRGVYDAVLSAYKNDGLHADAFHWHRMTKDRT